MTVTVREFLRQYPNAALDLITPKGIVQIPSGYGPWLLSDKSRNAVFKTNGSKLIVPATELLEQIILRVFPYRGSDGKVFLLTNAVPNVSYQPQIEYEQMEFDLRQKHI